MLYKVYDWFISDDSSVIDFETVALGISEAAQSLNITSRSQYVDGFECCRFELIYEAQGQVFTLANLQEICEFEQLVFQNPDYPLLCKTDDARGNETRCSIEPSSLSHAFYDFNYPVACASLNESSFNESLAALYSHRQGSFFTGENGGSAVSRIVLGGPLGADSTGGKSYETLVAYGSEEQFVYYKDFFLSMEKSIFARYGVEQSPSFSTPYSMKKLPIGNGLKVRFYTYALFVEELSRVANNDITFVLFAIVLVYCFSYFHVVRFQLPKVLEVTNRLVVLFRSDPISFVSWP